MKLSIISKESDNLVQKKKVKINVLILFFCSSSLLLSGQIDVNKFHIPSQTTDEQKISFSRKQL